MFNVRSICVRYFCVSLLFSCSNCILHDFFTLYTLLGSLLIIVFFPTLIYLTPFYNMSVGQVSHSLQSYLIGRRQLSIKILPTWTPPNRLRGIRTKWFNVTPQNFHRFPASLLFSVEFHPLICTVFQYFHQVFHSQILLILYFT